MQNVQMAFQVYSNFVVSDVIAIQVACKSAASFRFTKPS